MLSKFDIQNDEIIPVCVMATMSSGKSTFLNAILGDEVLPEKNEACTARALAVLNCPGYKDTKAFIRKSDGKKYSVDIFYPNTVSKINADETVSDVLIVKDFQSISNTRRSVVLLDTPGVNNSGDIRHAERTKEVLDQLNQGVIIYILNATQLATNDDELLLQMVIDHVKKTNVSILFVLNKIDMLDEDKESIRDTINNAVAYIKDHGLEKFEIFPLSALSAKIFKMKLNGKSLTKAETRHLNQSYIEYKDDSKSMLRYAQSYNRFQQDYIIDNETVSEYSLRRAVENTGIVEIERAIERKLLRTEQQKPKKIDLLKEYKEIEGVYSRKRKSKNIANYVGEVHWICRSCKQINGSDQTCLSCHKANVKWRKSKA